MSMFTTISSGTAAHQHKPEASASPFVAMRPTQRLLVLGIFWIYLLGVVLLALAHQTTGAEWIIPALIVFVALQVAPLVCYQPGYGWFHPLIFGALMSLLMLLQSFPMYAWGLESHNALPGYGPAELARLIAYALALNAISLLAYYAGFFFGPTCRIPRLTFSHPRHLTLKVLVVVVLALAVFVVFIQRQGGLKAHILSWGASRHVAVGGEHYWIQLASWSRNACLIWLAFDRTSLRNPLFWGSATLSLVVAFLGTGSRAAVIFSIAMGMLVWMIRERKIIGMRTLLFILVAVMLINILGSFRRSTWDGAIDWAVLTSFSADQALSTQEIVERGTANSGMLPILARVPHEVDLLYGDSYLAVLLLPVPRGLWEDKPGLVGGRVGQTFFNKRAGVSPEPIGEAFWNFHIPGVLIVFFAFGAFHQWLAAVFRRYADKPAIILPYALTLFTVSPSGPGIVKGLLTLVPVLLLLRLFGALKGGAEHEPA